MTNRDATAQLITLFDRNRAAHRQGVYSVCCAHPLVIRAALELARDRGQVAIIESTCNQVNQDGGYTGMTPEIFAGQVRATAREIGLPEDRLVLGGDHLGPQPWRKLSADAAMAKAITMVEAYAAAGYGKLHLDCSMPCGDDPAELSDVVVAERAARLAAAAEAVVGDATLRPVYVVGTEVPAPGGMGEGHAIVPTAPGSVRETWRAHEQAFAAAGLADALSRVVAIVVQPGLDFGNEDVVRFVPEHATDLSESVLALDRAVFEAHSTDYQQPESYAALVDMHFAILKVGPAATFALREAIYALEALARELPGWDARYSVRSAMEAAMLRDPSHWASHYAGDDARQAYLRHFSYSDRLRYYWTEPAVEKSMSELFGFLDGQALPLPLISQFLPQHVRAVSSGEVAATASDLCRANVRLALTPYADACGSHASDDMGALEPLASVTLRDLAKSFDAATIIKGVSLTIEHGEFVALVGPSGSGKSTLLRLIAGLETASGGEIEIDGRVVNDVPPKHRDIAMVFQNYALYPHMTVAENLAFALKMRGVGKAEIARRVAETASALNLTALLDRYPRQLSGGQRQRVATGRAIVRDPQVFLFDEPLSNLDAKLRVQVRAELRQLHRRLGVTSIYVTHDQVEAMTMADKIVVLRDGRIEQVGAPLDLYDRPDNVFVATFIGSPAMNLLEGRYRDQAIVLTDGSVLAVCPALAVATDTPLTIGVRPEHIDVVTDGAGGIAARLVALEPTGAETLIMADLAGTTVTVVTKERIALRPGDPIRIRPVLDKQLYFDGDGQRLVLPERS